ncbi:MAG: hypothetical protein QOG62_1880 [Thermoleophilaceae bacterium]|jgi:hypothetical protein|nr:hypothetical protein [Thermoleophilaceae bacterium]
MRTKFLSLAGIALLGVFAAGCGGGATETAAVESGVSKAQFIEQGDTLCGQYDAKIAAAAKKAGKGASDPKWIEKTIVPDIKAQIDGVRSLTPPAGDEAAITDMLDASDKALKAGEKDPPSLMLSSGEDKSPFYDVAEDLAAYGFKVCAQPAT